MLAIFLAVLPLIAQAAPVWQPVGGQIDTRNNTHFLPRDEPFGDKDLFQSCPGVKDYKGRRADTCVLINIKNNPDKIIYTNLGSPQLNCAGGTTPVRVSLGGSSSVSSSTTVEAHLGISFAGISIGGGMSTTDTKSQTISKTITYLIPPGRQAVFTAGTNFHSQTGNVKVNYGVKVHGHYEWYTTAKVTKLIPDGAPPRYQVHESKCGSDPNDLSKVNHRSIELEDGK